MKTGDRYRINNTTLSGNLIVEGIATLVELTDSELLWAVRFDDESDRTYQRFVDPSDKVN